MKSELCINDIGNYQESLSYVIKIAKSFEYIIHNYDDKKVFTEIVNLGLKAETGRTFLKCSI
jgi:hypothetical protein